MIENCYKRRSNYEIIRQLQSNVKQKIKQLCIIEKYSNPGNVEKLIHNLKIKTVNTLKARGIRFCSFPQPCQRHSGKQSCFRCGRSKPVICMLRPSGISKDNPQPVE